MQNWHWFTLTDRSCLLFLHIQTHLILNGTNPDTHIRSLSHTQSHTQTSRANSSTNTYTRLNIVWFFFPGNKNSESKKPKFISGGMRPKPKAKPNEPWEDIWSGVQTHQGWITRGLGDRFCRRGGGVACYWTLREPRSLRDVFLCVTVICGFRWTIESHGGRMHSSYETVSIDSVSMWVGGCLLYYSNLRHCGGGRPQWISSTVINVLQNKRREQSLREQGHKEVSDRTGRWQQDREYPSRRLQSARTLDPHRQIPRSPEQFSTAFSITSDVLLPRKELPIRHWSSSFHIHPFFSVT